MSTVGLSTKNAPSPWVVLPHYALGAIAFLVASVMLFLSAGDLTVSYVGPKILSLTHVLVLGWVSMLIFGALYQLIPVVMEVRLYSEKLAYTSLVLLTLGTALMSWEFWYSYIGYSHIKYTGGLLIILAIIFFAFNVLKTALTNKNKTIENKFIVSSVYWLLAAVLIGMFTLLNSVYQWVPKSNIDLLKIHVLVALVGWFMMLIIGVASTLMPMFFIVHNLNKKFLKIAFASINISILTGIVALYFSQNILLWLAILGILTGMLLFFKYNFNAYKKRLRKKLDIGMKLSVFAFIVFEISILSGVISVFIMDLWPQYMVKVYLIFGASLILGFFTILILGQMYKTLPFIVWLQKYQDKVGKFKTPLPNEMYSEKVADGHYYSVLLAIVALIVGIILSNQVIIQIAAVAFIATALLYAYNTFVIIFHKEKVEPLKKIEINK